MQQICCCYICLACKLSSEKFSKCLLKLLLQPWKLSYIYYSSLFYISCAIRKSPLGFPSYRKEGNMPPRKHRTSSGTKSGQQSKRKNRSPNVSTAKRLAESSRSLTWFHQPNLQLTSPTSHHFLYFILFLSFCRMNIRLLRQANPGVSHELKL